MSDGSTNPDLVELVRRTTDAADRQDLDALMSICAPDGVYDTTPSGLGTYAGPVAIRAFLGEWWDAFEELHATLEEVVDLGGGVTFSIIRQDARPAGSASSVSTREAHVTEWRAGMAVRVTVYTDLEQGARLLCALPRNERGPMREGPAPSVERCHAEETCSRFLRR